MAADKTKKTRGDEPRLTDLFHIGQRVQTAPHTDAWMSGDRFGEVISVGHKWVQMRSERSGIIRRFRAEDLLPAHQG